MSRKLIIKFLNKSVYCIYIETANIFLYYLQIIVSRRQIFKKLNVIVYENEK